MRLTSLSLLMTATTLSTALLFVHAMDTPAGSRGPLLRKYAAGWRTALVVDAQRNAPPSPLTSVTIINAPPH